MRDKDKLTEGGVHVGYGGVNGPLQPRGVVTRGTLIEGDTRTEFSYNGPPSLLKRLLAILRREADKDGKKVHSNNADQS